VPEPPPPLRAAPTVQVEPPAATRSAWTAPPPRASEIETIRIGDDEIHGVRGPDGAGYVVLRRACEVLGLDPSGQRQKLQGQPWATAETISAVAEDGKTRELFCLHADSVPMWLATLDASRCAPGARDRIVRFQREAARVLADWAYGRKPEPSPSITREQRIAQALLESAEIIAERDAKIAEQALCLTGGSYKRLFPGPFLPTGRAP
jgi:hypothetical protein